MMRFFSGSRLNAGVDITPRIIRSVLLSKNQKTFLIKKISEVAIPRGIIKPSFKKENILEPDQFSDCLEQVLNDIDVKKISASLPDSAIRVFIQKFKDMPGKKHEIHQMILWKISAALSLPADELRLSWQDTLLQCCWWLSPPSL